MNPWSLGNMKKIQIKLFPFGKCHENIKLKSRQLIHFHHCHYLKRKRKFFYESCLKVAKDFKQLIWKIFEKSNCRLTTMKLFQSISVDYSCNRIIFPEFFQFSPDRASDPQYFTTTWSFEPDNHLANKNSSALVNVVDLKN